MVRKTENDEQGKLALWKKYLGLSFCPLRSMCTCVGADWSFSYANMSWRQSCSGVRGRRSPFAISVIHGCSDLYWV